MAMSNNSTVMTIYENEIQEGFSDLVQTLKLGISHDMITGATPSTYNSLQLQNQFLKNQVNELQKLVLQYEFTNKKALETLRENIMLRDKNMTLELKIGILSETADLQSLEIKKRDHSISSLRKDTAEHNKRIEIMSEKFEENGYPACDVCCRNPPIVTICKNHPESGQIVGCIFCALRKCPMCRSKTLDRSFVQPESKKIKKVPREKDCGEDGVACNNKKKISKEDAKKSKYIAKNKKN